ncbi:hypothetical protein BJF78_19750 [Pseudonocardia sp. CNS-139]|nr:hypothetical protein BJF78_19750 [Pseudonocardia sp. CNS-139]
MGARAPMTATQTVDRVLVVGPLDLVTTSVTSALRAHGFAAALLSGAEPVPPAPARAVSPS